MNRPLNQPVPLEVAAGVHRLSGGVANFYLVEQAGRLTLIDAGTPGDWGLLLRALSDMGRRLEHLDAVILTQLMLTTPASPTESAPRSARRSGSITMTPRSPKGPSRVRTMSG